MSVWHALWCRAAGRLQVAEGAQALSVTDVSGRPVRGIVCDNLRGMPETLRNRLLLPLPETLHGIPLICTLTNANSTDNYKFPKSAKLKTTENTGTLRLERDRLIYTPPDEFNTNPEPQRLSDIQRETHRVVLLTVRRMEANGEETIVAQQPLILARPPIVAVHGINSSQSSSTWSGKDRLVSHLKDAGHTIVWVEHGRQDFDPRNPLNAPALEFHGNGPVEEGAQQVAAAVTQTLQSVRQTQHLAIRRVDLLGYSYGGLIARWYLHSFRLDARAEDSVRWYVRSANTGAVKPLYCLEPEWYAKQRQKKQEGRSSSGHGTKEEKNNEARIEGSGLSDFTSPLSALPPVRKLITVASMWRGIPLCNYVNEIHAPDNEGTRLADAPLLGQRIGMFVDGDLAPLLPTRVPAMEVMAVNSPWLTVLNNFVEGDQRKPFLDTVAYGCVAGDDNAFLSLTGAGARLDPYSILRLAQVPSWFPYLALEQHPNSDQNYSDGLVPLWSAVISDNFDHFQLSRIVRANHDSILNSRSAWEYVACALNNRAWLPSGRLLNAHWGSAVTSRELLPTPEATYPQNGPIPEDAFGPSRTSALPSAPRRAWTFLPGEMAPHLQNQLYPQIGLLGRTNPEALREIRQVQIETITKNSAIVSWRTAAELNGFVGVTHWEQVNYGAYDDVEVNCLIEPIGSRVTRMHRFRISNLQPNTTYQVIVTSEAISATDDIVAVRSEPVRFTTSF